MTNTYKHTQSNKNMILFIVYNLLENISEKPQLFAKEKKNNEIA